MGVRNNTPKVDNVLIHVDDTISPKGDLNFRCQFFPAIWHNTQCKYVIVIVYRSKGLTLPKPHCLISIFLFSPRSCPGPRVCLLFVRTHTFDMRSLYQKFLAAFSNIMAKCFIHLDDKGKMPMKAVKDLSLVIQRSLYTPRPLVILESPPHIQFQA